ncbi:MAG TPA: hypothetical protein VFW00_09130 [Rhodocyclaceae bacterium]|nr:hypothetical protein [Rhodocyclaceae bacterium]
MRVLRNKLFKVSTTVLALAAVFSMNQAGATASGFAGNVTGGGDDEANEVYVSTMAGIQNAINAYSGSGGLHIIYLGSFASAPILANICAQWSKPRQEVLINSKNDITIEGGDGTSANFGIRIQGTSSNIIVRNMTIGLVPGGGNNGDAIGIQGSAHNVLIDHNELYSQNTYCPGTPGDDTTFDGLLDIRDTVDNITVAYNFIHDHNKVGLDGSSDTDLGTAATGGRHLTFAYNRYQNVGQRLPLQRGGVTHIYNNYYNGITVHGINVRVGGLSLIEGNWFENALNPVTARLSATLGTWTLKNNNITSAADFPTYNITWSPETTPGFPVFVNADSWQSTANPAVTVPYAYTPSPASQIKCIVLATAGAGRGNKEVGDLQNSCANPFPDFGSFVRMDQNDTNANIRNLWVSVDFTPIGQMRHTAIITQTRSPMYTGPGSWGLTGRATYGLGQDVNDAYEDETGSVYGSYLVSYTTPVYDNANHDCVAPTASTPNWCNIIIRNYYPGLTAATPFTLNVMYQDGATGQWRADWILVNNWLNAGVNIETITNRIYFRPSRVTSWSQDEDTGLYYPDAGSPRSLSFAP